MLAKERVNELFPTAALPAPRPKLCYNSPQTILAPSAAVPDGTRRCPMSSSELRLTELSHCAG